MSLQRLKDLLIEPGSSLIRDPMDHRLRDFVVRDISRCPTGSVCIIGYPWDWSIAGDPGSRYAPYTIRRALYEMNIHNVSSEYGVCDLGDVRVAPGDYVLSERRLEEVIDTVSETCRGVVVLGGDHSLTRTVLRGLLRRHEKIDLIVFDAHLDMRQLSEGRSSGTYLREAIEELGDRLRVFVIGYRRHSNPEYMIRYARERGVEIIDIETVKKSISRVIEYIADHVASNRIYFSVDADSLDPAQCPGVNSLSPDGLLLRELIDLIRGVSGRSRARVVGGDVVEVVPRKDLNDICSRNMAYVVLEMIRIISSQS